MELKVVGVLIQHSQHTEEKSKCVEHLDLAIALLLSIARPNFEKPNVRIEESLHHYHRLGRIRVMYG